MLDVVDHHDLSIAFSIGAEAKVTDTDLPVRNAGEGFDILWWVPPLVGHDVVELRDDPLLYRRVEPLERSRGRRSKLPCPVLTSSHG